MKYQDLIKSIRKKNFTFIYYFTGTEKKISRMMETRLIRAAVTDGLTQLNVMYFKEKETDIKDILSIARQFPIMSPYRVVVIRETTELCHTSDTATIDLFLDYLNHPEKTTIMIVCDPKPDKRKKIYKELSKASYHVEFNKLNLVELENWVTARFKRSGKKIDMRTLKYFIDKTLYLTNDDIDISMVDNRIAQLIDYTNDTNIINQQIINEVVPTTVDDNIFRMIDFAVQGNMPGALTMLHTFYLQGESPFSISGLLAEQIRTMIQVRLLIDQRMPSSLVAKQVARPYFVVKKLDRTSQHFGLERLITLVLELADLDEWMKTGKIDSAIAVELFILRFR